MPIYEYYCTRCNHEEDLLQKFGELAIAKCPECGKKTFKRKISAPGFQLKGTGWYETDFKNNGKPSKEPVKAKSEKSDTGGKDGGDSKPAKDSAGESKSSSESVKSKGNQQSASPE